MELQRGGVLDGDDALVRRDVRGEYVEGGRLTGAGTTGDDDVETAPDTRPQEVGDPLGHRAEADQVGFLVRVDGELTDRQEGAADRQWSDDGVDAGPVGQAGVDHRGGLVDPASDLTDDLVDDPP